MTEINLDMFSVISLKYDFVYMSCRKTIILRDILRSTLESRWLSVKIEACLVQCPDESDKN